MENFRKFVPRIPQATDERIFADSILRKVTPVAERSTSRLVGVVNSRQYQSCKRIESEVIACMFDCRHQQHVDVVLDNREGHGRGMQGESQQSTITGKE